jgi:hypothetical protein
MAKVGRPILNPLREGVPSKICFLCYGEPLSMYEVSIILYERPMPNVQGWMKRLVRSGYLEHVKREVVHIPGRRPKGDTGYQLVASKVVDEMDGALAKNTNGKLFFTDDERRSLTEFLDSEDARTFMAAISPRDIAKLDRYDLCSIFSTLFWNYASSSKKRISTDSRDFLALEKHVSDPSFVRVIKAAVKALSQLEPLLGSGITEDEARSFVNRFVAEGTLVRLARFSSRFSDFISKCSPEFLEKLSWSGQTALPSIYQFIRLGVTLPSIMKGIMRNPAVQELIKTVESGAE